MQILQGVLLDVDGTLVDSNDAHAHAWVKAMSENGYEATFAKVRRLIGKGGDKLLPDAVGLSADSPAGQAISRRRGEIFREEFLPSLEPFPAVVDLLSRMRQSHFRLAVASSANKDELSELLRICGADQFIDAQTSSDDVENSKPDPEIIQTALKRLGLSPAQAILLGDTPYDVEAGLRAGVSVVALRCGGWEDADLAGATAIYDSPEDLLRGYANSPFSASGR